MLESKALQPNQRQRFAVTFPSQMPVRARGAWVRAMERQTCSGPEPLLERGQPGTDLVIVLQSQGGLELVDCRRVVPPFELVEPAGPESAERCLVGDKLENMHLLACEAECGRNRVVHGPEPVGTSLSGNDPS